MNRRPWVSVEQTTRTRVILCPRNREMSNTRARRLLTAQGQGFKGLRISPISQRSMKQEIILFGMNVCHMHVP